MYHGDVFLQIAILTLSVPLPRFAAHPDTYMNACARREKLPWSNGMSSYSAAFYEAFTDSAASCSRDDFIKS